MGVGSSKVAKPNTYLREERICFFWVWSQTEIYQKLSSNVIREICLYIEQLPFPPFLFDKDKLYVLDIATQKWKPPIHYPTTIPCCRGCAAVFFLNHRILICGGVIIHSPSRTSGKLIERRRHGFFVAETKSCYELDLQGGITQRPDLIENRIEHSLVFHSGVFYTFGGNVETKSPEMLALGNSQWEALPPMPFKFEHNSACIKDEIIWILAAKEHTIIHFDTLNRNYSVVELESQFSGPVSIAIDFNKLVVLFRNEFRVIPLSNLGCFRSVSAPGRNFGTECPLVVARGKIFSGDQWDLACGVIDLRTGSKVEVFVKEESA